MYPVWGTGVASLNLAPAGENQQLPTFPTGLVPPIVDLGNVSETAQNGLFGDMECAGDGTMASRR